MEAVDAHFSDYAIKRVGDIRFDGLDFADDAGGLEEIAPHERNSGEDAKENDHRQNLDAKLAPALRRRRGDRRERIVISHDAYISDSSSANMLVTRETPVTCRNSLSRSSTRFESRNKRR